MSILGSGLSDTLRDFAAEVGKPSQHRPGEPWSTVMRQAVIKSVSGASGSAPVVSIAFPEDPPGVSIPDVKYLHPYVPQVGDTVWVMKNGPDLLIVCKMRGNGDQLTTGDPHASPREGFSSKGPDAGFNTHDRSNSAKRTVLYADSGKARLWGSSSGDMLTGDLTSGNVEVPAGSLTASGGPVNAQHGAAVTGGDLSSSGGNVSSSGGGNHIEQTVQVNGNADGGVILGGSTVSHSRVFEGTDSKLYVQPGGGNYMVFRSSAGNPVGVYDLGGKNFGVGTVTPNRTLDTGAGGDLYAEKLYSNIGMVMSNKVGINGAAAVRDLDVGTGHSWIQNNDCSLAVNGNLSCTGTKPFVIDHPSRKGHKLVHICPEGPEAAVFYRGTAKCRKGRAEVKLPAYFEKLTEAEGRTVDVTQVLVDEETDLALLAASAPVDGRFVVRSSVPDAEFSWTVWAVRAGIDLPIEPTHAEYEAHVDREATGRRHEAALAIHGEMVAALGPETDPDEWRGVEEIEGELDRLVAHGRGRHGLDLAAHRPVGGNRKLAKLRRAAEDRREAHHREVMERPMVEGVQAAFPGAEPEIGALYEKGGLGALEGWGSEIVAWERAARAEERARLAALRSAEEYRGVDGEPVAD